jgi:hypothetical protein
MRALGGILEHRLPTTSYCFVSVMTMRYLLGFTLLLVLLSQNLGVAADLRCTKQIKDHGEKAIAAFEKAFQQPAPRTACTVVLLSGVIVRGDVEKLKSAFRDSRGFLETVNLTSPGGDLGEAMKLGKLIRAALLSTNAPWELIPGQKSFPPLDYVGWNPCTEQDCICASACFVAWAAGVKRAGHLLAVHRPRFEPSYFAGLDLATAQREYQRSLAELKAYLSDVDVPATYYERMLATPSTDIATLSKDDAWALTVVDYPPAIDEWLISKCGSVGKADRDAMLAYGATIKLKDTRPLTEREYQQLMEKWISTQTCRAKTIIETRRALYKAESP